MWNICHTHKGHLLTSLHRGHQHCYIVTYVETRKEYISYFAIFETCANATYFSVDSFTYFTICNEILLKWKSIRVTVMLWKECISALTMTSFVTVTQTHYMNSCGSDEDDKYLKPLASDTSFNNS